ncbi:MAG TPA: RNA polymerase sigma factor [Longimicrobiales bacterium]|nr:RNA polymerase sigma factor [Longimicrobiales bacterium]
MRPQEEEFLALLRENDARLRRICRVYGSDPEDVRDLYQDILVQLWRSLPSFAGDSEMGTWVYRVALNTALSHRRKRDTRRAAREEKGDAPLWATVSPAPDRALEEKQRLDRLHGAIRRLDDLDRALVTMYLDDRSYREMAEVLGISETNVGVKLHRIRKRLAAWLTEGVQ